MTYVPLVTIQSAGRTRQVDKMLQFLAPIIPIWYVPAVQAEAYERAGAKVRSVEGILPMKPKQLNAALEDGFAEGRYVITMDDDFVGARIAKEGPRVELPDIVRDLYYELEKSALQMALCSTDGWQLRNGPMKPAKYGMGMGALHAHKPGPLRYDENLKQVEDLDYVIQHHLSYGGVVLLRKYVVEFDEYKPGKSRNYSGGYANYRNGGGVSDTVRYLSEKYPILEFEDMPVNESIFDKIRWQSFARVGL